MKNKLLIIGASGHGKVVADIALKMNKWEFIGFIDDNKSIKSSIGIEVIAGTKAIDGFIDEYEIFVGVGNNSIRKDITEKLEKLGATIPVLIHPSSVVGENVSIENGTVIMAGTVINPSTVIGKGCIINTGSTVDHDNKIEDFVHISPGAHLAGYVEVGEGAWLGTGSTVSNNISIIGNCIIGAGGVVIRDLTELGTYVGVPVRRL